jgi:hypothetical protein
MDHFRIFGPKMKVQKVTISIENFKSFKYQNIELIYRFVNSISRHNIALGEADLWRLMNNYVGNERCYPYSQNMC